MDEKSMTVSVAGKQLTFKTGKIARQANGAVMLECGDTHVLSTACAKSEPAPEIDFFPLQVHYLEKFSSTGKTLGGFIKREGRLSEKETLASRLIDRPLRPMFEDGFFNEVQILNYVMSYESNCPPEPLAICAASAALVVSDIPLKKPVAGVRVGRIDDKYIINPSIEEQESSELDLLIAGTEDAILMIEGYCDFLTEEQVLEAIEEGHNAISTICQHLSDWQKLVGKEKMTPPLTQAPEKLLTGIKELVHEDLTKALSLSDKNERDEQLAAIHAKVNEKFLPEENREFSKTEVQIGFKKTKSEYMRDMIFKTHKRSDGRACDEVRPIYIDQGILPRAHGSSLFTRGETQTIAVCTLGPENMGQRYETLEGDGLRRFYLQYFFPPFCVGEVGRMGPAARREVGHGKLAERAVEASIPSLEKFPYTIRLESNITESNGSSSMASVCGGCLALMNAGVPIKKPVAGIAMGLLLKDNDYMILSDILGVEDALGDMDFKITGDKDGITAFQLDIKVEGITKKIMQVALEQAKQGRIHILNKMLEAAPKHSDKLSAYAPKIESMQVKPSKIAVVIGPGGKNIKGIIEETGVEVNINDDGIVSFSSTDAEKIEQAKEMVHNLVGEVEEGGVYTGKVVSIKEFGMFVKIFSQDGLCHISEIDHSRVENVEDFYKIGDSVEVKVLEINNRGQVKLSRKALLPKVENADKDGGSKKERDPQYEEPKQKPQEKRESTPKKVAILPPPPIVK